MKGFISGYGLCFEAQRGVTMNHLCDVSKIYAFLIRETYTPADVLAGFITFLTEGDSPNHAGFCGLVLRIWFNLELEFI